MLQKWQPFFSTSLIASLYRSPWYVQFWAIYFSGINGSLLAGEQCQKSFSLVVIVAPSFKNVSRVTPMLFFFASIAKKNKKMQKEISLSFFLILENPSVKKNLEFALYRKALQIFQWKLDITWCFICIIRSCKNYLKEKARNEILSVSLGNKETK